MSAQLADVPITVEILPEAQRMSTRPTERWVAEHGFLADNPLLDEILRASDLLRTNPQIGVIVRRGRSEIRRLLLHSGWHLYYRLRADRQLVEILSPAGQRQSASNAAEAAWASSAARNSSSATAAGGATSSASGGRADDDLVRRPRSTRATRIG